MLSDTLYIGRQPILDRNEGIFAYELLFRSSEDGNIAVFDDDVKATSRVLVNTLNNIGLDKITGGHKGFINANTALLNDELLSILPKERFILAILEHCDVTDRMIGRIDELRAEGYLVALDDFVFNREYLERFKPLIGRVDYIKIEVNSCEISQLESQVPKLKKLGVKLLAEKVETKEMFDRCKALGFDYFQGYYFAKPEIIREGGIEPAQLVVAKLINLLMKDADNETIEQTFKEEPGITLNLLKYINSASIGLKSEIKSIRHAIMLLGKRKLLQWVTLISYADAKGGSLNFPLLQVVQFRAKSMELLLGTFDHLGDHTEEEAFMTGLLSMLDALFNLPMEQVIHEFSIDMKIKEAILFESNELGVVLQLVKYMERDHIEGINTLANVLQIELSKMIKIKIDAIQWADETSQSLLA